MAFRVNAYEADETNVNRMWDLEANRTNHIKNLDNIYKEKQAMRTKSEKDHLKRQKQLGQYQTSKTKNFANRNKQTQDRINYENSLLRNKILNIYEKPMPPRKCKSFFLNIDHEKLSPCKNKFQTMHQTNLKIGERLSNIKSRVGTVCKIEAHSKRADELLEMIQKKSPKKRAYLKSLTRQRLHYDLMLPEFDDINVELGQ